MAGTLTVDTIQSDSSYASTLNVTSNVAFTASANFNSNVAFTSPVNFTGGMRIGGQDATFGGMRNRIINGDMRIDQRAAGANTTVTTSGYFSVDRFASSTNVSSKYRVGQNLNNISAPNGFYNYLGFQSLSSYSSGSSDYSAIYQSIEGYNLIDLNLGSSSGSPFTISFWVRSSLTGTFTFVVSASYGSNAGYATTYTINSANTWEYKTITIPATSIGTWNTTNGLGMMLWWDLGTGSSYSGTANTWSTNYTLKVAGTQSIIGTNSATFYITGVQFEKGSAASPFEYRQYGQEFTLCQRYYQDFRVNINNGSGPLTNFIDGSSGTRVPLAPTLVTMRASPTITPYTTGGVSGSLTEFSAATNMVATANPFTYNYQGGAGYWQMAGTLTNAVYQPNTYSAEL